MALLAKAKGETQHMHARLRESRLAERVSGLQAERAREDAEATYRAGRECSASATQTPQGGVHHGSGYAVWVNTPAADAVYFVREHAVEGAEETTICEGAEGATPSQYLQRVSGAATLTPPCASLRKEASPRVTVLPASMASREEHMEEQWPPAPPPPPGPFERAASMPRGAMASTPPNNWWPTAPPNDSMKRPLSASRRSDTLESAASKGSTIATRCRSPRPTWCFQP